MSLLDADDGLTNKERLFAEEYVTCWNASEAARRAGYKLAPASGPENLNKPKIQKLISQKMAEKAMKADEVLARLADMARGNMSDFLTVNGHKRIDFKKAEQAGKMHLIKSYSKGTRSEKVELYDSLAALEKIGKHLALFVDRVDINSQVNETQVTIYIPDNGRQDGANDNTTTTETGTIPE